MFTKHTPPRNFLVLYSAGIGEQAVESLSSLRPRPQFAARRVLPHGDRGGRVGVDFKELAERVKLMVRATAQASGRATGAGIRRSWADPRDETYKIGAVGREGNQIWRGGSVRRG